jgi:hypothetical protein
MDAGKLRQLHLGQTSHRSGGGEVSSIRKMHHLNARDVLANSNRISTRLAFSRDECPSSDNLGLLAAR